MAAPMIASVRPPHIDAGTEGCFARSTRRTLESELAVFRLGNARLRKALGMPVLKAVRLNPWLRAYYDRLVSRRKPRKVALVAAIRKLLAAVWSIARNRKLFVPQLANVSLT
jgi:transposase